MTNGAATQTITELLTEHWPGTSLAADPVPLAGGFWASMHRLSVIGQPPGIPSTLVFRVAPDGPMGAKELAVQRSVAALGFATPEVRLAGDAQAGTWSIMDFAAGAPPLQGLDGVAALRRGPSILRRLPGQLVGPLAHLHALDPTTVTRAVTAEAPSVAWTVEELLDRFVVAAEALGDADLSAMVGRLARSRPTAGQSVVCHGDYHPFNLLIGDDGAATVLDWTGAILADPAFDLAFTTLLLENPPLHAPSALRPPIAAVGRRLAKSFLEGYRTAAPGAALESLDWYRGLHGARILIEITSMRSRDPGAQGHPFFALRPAAEAAVAHAI